EPDEEVELRAGAGDPALEAAVCPKTRHIVWLEQGGACPKIGNWTGKLLFAKGTPFLAERDIALSGELAKVCRYEWTLPGVTPTQARGRGKVAAVERIGAAVKRLERCRQRLGGLVQLLDTPKLRPLLLRLRQPPIRFGFA